MDGIKQNLKSVARPADYDGSVRMDVAVGVNNLHFLTLHNFRSMTIHIHYSHNRHRMWFPWPSL